MPKPRRSAQETRKLWTRDYLILRLEKASEAMEKAVEAAGNGEIGKMPKALRKSALVEAERARKVVAKIKAWAVTEREKADKLVAEQKERELKDAGVVTAKPKPQLAGFKREETPARNGTKRNRLGLDKKKTKGAKNARGNNRKDKVS